MNKLVFLILTILIISIKSQWENEKIGIHCTKLYGGKYKCYYYTRHSSCYNGFGHYRSYVKRCEVTDLTEYEKRVLEHAIEKERWQFEEEEEDK